MPPKRMQLRQPMCSPALVMAGFGLAETGFQIVQGYQDAATAKVYQDQLIKQSQQQQALNRQLALESYSRQADAENTRLAQEEAAATERTLQANIRAARAAAEARVDATHAGVAGISVNSLYDEFARENARYTDAIRMSREHDRIATALRKQGFGAEARNRVLSFTPYQPRPIEEPSLIGSLLKIGGSAAKGYADYTLWNQRKSGGGGPSS